MAMLQSEALFFNDSLAVLRVLALLDEIGEGQHRFMLAVMGIDLLLDDFGFSPDRKRVLVKTLQAAFFSEWGGNPVLSKQLNDKYRKYRMSISYLLRGKDEKDSPYYGAAQIFRVRSRMNAPLIRELCASMQSDSGREDFLMKLLSSYLHMFMNRMFIAQQRKYELVMYHFLEKHYGSMIAQANIAGGTG
jgi:thiopeptide-type bacteriocin biosynthesis protein